MFNMDKKLLHVAALFLSFAVFALPSFAADKKAPLTDEEAEQAEIVTRLTKVKEPYLDGNNLIFTAGDKARFVGIAFDFEDFHVIHPYRRYNTYDDDGKVTSSLFFYILPLKKEMTKINYRIVVDGLWTLDPTNKTTVYDPGTRLTLSQVDATRDLPPATEVKDGKVRFVYTGKTGQHVRIGGSFTNWDSWIYEMKEVKPGVYQFDLTLPPGTYEYAYYSGVNTFADVTNPERCYTPDGKIASLIIVN